MSWPKGKPRPEGAGRKKGVPNRKTQALVDLVFDSGKDPLQTLLDLLTHEDVSIKLAAAKELCQYLYPKRKAVEISGEHKLTTTFEKLDGTREHYTLGPSEDDEA